MSNTSRLGRLVLSSLATLSLLLTTVQPAAAVTDPADGYWRFTLYKDAACEGAYVGPSGTGTNGSTQLADLGDWSFNDKATSWSFCNGTSTTIYVTVKLWTGTNFSGTEITPVSHHEVQPDACVTGNHITPNDSVSSYRLTLSTT